MLGSTVQPPVDPPPRVRACACVFAHGGHPLPTPQVAPNLSEYAVVTAFARVDGDGDGRVSFRDFEVCGPVCVCVEAVPGARRRGVRSSAQAAAVLSMPGAPLRRTHACTCELAAVLMHAPPTPNLRALAGDDAAHLLARSDKPTRAGTWPSRLSPRLPSLCYARRFVFLASFYGRSSAAPAGTVFKLVYAHAVKTVRHELTRLRDCESACSLRGPRLFSVRIQPAESTALQTQRLACRVLPRRAS